MLKFGRFFTVISILAAIAPAVRAEPPADATEPTETRTIVIDVDADWLDGGEELKPEHFERLILLGERDPEVAALFERAKKRFGWKDIREFRNFIEIKRITSAGRTLRQTFSYRYYPTLTQLVDAENAPEKLRASMEERIKADFTSKKVLLMEIRHELDYVEVSTLEELQVIIVPKRTILSSYTTLIHELMHAVDEDPFHEPDPVLYPDFEKMKIDEVSLPGNEVEAYLFESRARYFLTKDASRFLSAVKPFFSEQGEFNGDRLGFAKAVLKPTAEGGLGYDRVKFNDYIPELLRRTESQTVKFRNRLASEINLRNQEAAVSRQRIGAAANNLPIFQARLERARAQKDKGHEDQAQADIAYWTDLEARSKARLNAAEAAVSRLTEKLNDRDAYLVKLRARIDRWNADNTPVSE